MMGHFNSVVIWSAEHAFCHHEPLAVLPEMCEYTATTSFSLTGMILFHLWLSPGPLCLRGLCYNICGFFFPLWTACCLLNFRDVFWSAFFWHFFGCYGGLNDRCPSIFRHLNTWPPFWGTIWGGGQVGAMPSLEEVCHWGGFWELKDSGRHLSLWSACGLRFEIEALRCSCCHAYLLCFPLWCDAYLSGAISPNKPFPS